jgi:hypothetical protein
LAVAVAAAAFWFNRENLLGYIDGQYLLTLVRHQEEFALPGLGFSINPLQGLDDVWFAANTRWIPELRIAALFDDAAAQVVAVHTTAAVILFCVGAALAHWLGATRGGALAAGWLALLAIGPFSYPSAFYNVISDGPQLVSLQAFPLLLLLLWDSLGKGPAWRDAVGVVALWLGLWVHATAFGLFVGLSIPFLLVFGVASSLASWGDRRALTRKIACAAGLLVLLLLSGLPQALRGIVSDTAFHFFREQGARGETLLADGSLLLRVRDTASFLLSVLGVGSALVFARVGTGRVRWFAIATVVAALMLVANACVYAAIGQRGAIPLYYEYVMWPVYLVFVSFAMTAAWQRLVRPAPRLARSRLVRWLLPLAAICGFHGPRLLYGRGNDRPNVFPPAPTAITSFLQAELGLRDGAQLRGRVVSMTGQPLP